MTKFRTRLLISLFAIIVMVLAGLVILVGQVLKGYYSHSFYELNQEYGQIGWILLITLGVFLIVILFLGSIITVKYTKPIETATQVAMELAKGNYRARTTVDGLNDAGMLNKSINILAKNIEEMVKAQEIQQDRLTALIENIGAGLMLIDSRGYVNLINRGYSELFHVNPADYLFKQYYEVVGYEEICNLVTEVFKTEQKVRKQMLLPLFIERKYFDVYGVPIIGKNNAWKGILLAFHDITEMKKLEQMRKDFVANVSHELKTPVTSIKGFTETLLDGAMNNPETLKAFLSIILKESDRLQTLIQDLLDLSKIEQQEFKLTLQEVDLILLLNEVITMLKGKAQEKKIKIDIYQNQEQVIIEGDANRLKQVFINLIANAITYTPPDGEVKVILLEHGNSVRIHVKDSGVGIEKEEIPRIFERFYRVDRARSRNSGGTGLGLAIVKHLVEAHHGTISVRSNVGEGSEFIIELNKQLK
ncbi:PAS domain-containing sensor histidine kinase [Bacillus sp. MUM 116]|uniref:two-component system histidine kinase PnpS n=1 Tax=Bacillus sp. MUM 116 TaxID=1678002 RepID=UPI0008F5ACCF|nr:HAMP domain-containing sensor histidine kinase [Bacillus sp. MUM 116]OIK10001.1 PAS domain-containing sensor histidine kinase [Bacillus sp. MUM 116]